jgi:hypothetical protein
MGPGGCGPTRPHNPLVDGSNPSGAEPLVALELRIRAHIEALQNPSHAGAREGARCWTENFVLLQEVLGRRKLRQSITGLRRVND